jgi:hypothetical protein
MRKTGYILLPLLALVLVALPASLYASSTTNSPQAPDTDTRREACTHACERDQDNCRDSSATRLGDYGENHNVIGAGAACDKDLRDCLKRCR